MIKVITPNNNVIERQYILNVIFKEFLELDYQVELSDTILEWKLLLANDKSICILDGFFNKYQNDLQYLSEQNIPRDTMFGSNEFIPESDIPVIFGDNSLEVSNGSIACGLDIFASSFFMLTRWEEYVNKSRDTHDRFTAIDSYAYKNNFLDRPVVNEYVEMLWNMLVSLGYDGKRKKHQFETKVSHDVDIPIHSRYFDFKNLAKSSAKYLIKEKKIFKTLQCSVDFVNYKYRNKYKNDSVDTFDFLMDVSERYNISSNFYFKADCTDNVYDDKYAGKHKYIEPLISKISVRGHNVGLHPSYHTYLDQDQINKEYSSLVEILRQENIDQSKVGGRQHYLRFSAPYTWAIWNNLGLDYDSTLGYADISGFRCGVCYPYTVFDFLNRKHLKLVEYPLIVMEGTIFGYMNLNFEDGLSRMKSLKDSCKKYNGVFTLLWHNSFFEKKEYFKIYEEIVRY